MFMQKLLFVALKQLQTTLWIVDALLFFYRLWANAVPTLNTTFSMTNVCTKWWTRCLLISLISLLSHATSIYDRPKWVYGVFRCFQGQQPNLNNLIVQYHLWLKVSIPPLNRCFRITIIKLLLCWNIIFPSESNALSTHVQIFPLFWKFATVASLK